MKELPDKGPFVFPLYHGTPISRYAMGAVELDRYIEVLLYSDITILREELIVILGTSLYRRSLYQGSTVFRKTYGIASGQTQTG